MKNQLFFLSISIAFIFLGSACVAPVNSSYESAYTLGKGNKEVMGLYTHYIAAADGETEKSNDNFGFRAGLGVTENSDVKFQYIYLNSAIEDGINANYLSLAYKFSILKNYISASLPIGAYIYGEEGRL